VRGILLITGITLAFGIASSSYAVALTTPKGNAPKSNIGALPGLYVGVGAGVGGMDTPKLNDWRRSVSTSYTEKRRDGIAARAFLGYLWACSQAPNLKFGVETGYDYYSKNKYSLIGPAGQNNASWNYKGYNIDLLAVTKYNFGKTGFNAVLKGGAAYNHQVFSGQASSTRAITAGSLLYIKDTAHKVVKPKVAIGLGYDVNQNIDIGLMYSHMFSTKPAKNFAGITSSRVTNRGAAVDMILLTAAYHFGSLGKVVPVKL